LIVSFSFIVLSLSQDVYGFYGGEKIESTPLPTHCRQVRHNHLTPVAKNDKYAASWIKKRENRNMKSLIYVLAFAVLAVGASQAEARVTSIKIPEIKCKISDYDQLKDVEIAYGGSAQWSQVDLIGESHTESKEIFDAGKIKISNDGSFTLPKSYAGMPLRCTLGKTCEIFVTMIVWFDNNQSCGMQKVINHNFIYGLNTNDAEIQTKISELESASSCELKLFVNGNGYPDYELIIK
jgi:hypothetical protein